MEPIEQGQSNGGKESPPKNYCIFRLKAIGRQQQINNNKQQQQETATTNNNKIL